MRSLVAIGIGIGVVAVAAIVAVSLTATGTEARFPEGSPEAALQEYVDAVDAGDYEAAYAFFSSDVQEFMSLEEFERFSREMVPPDGPARRVLFDGMTTSETDGVETASLQLTVLTNSGGVFPSEYSYQTAVPMVREDGEWRIDQALVHVDPAPIPAPGMP